MDSRRKRRWIICLIISMCLSAFNGAYRSRSNHRTYQNYGVAVETAKEAEFHKEKLLAAEEQDSEDPDVKEDEETDAIWEQPEVINLSADGTGKLISDADAAALQHIKKYMVEGMSGSGTTYPVYAPEGSEGNSINLEHDDHGIFSFVMVVDGGEEETPYYMLEQTMETQQEDMEKYGDYSNVWVSGIMENGEDRYAVVTAMGTDVSGEPSRMRRLIYLDIQQPGVGALWQIDVMEWMTDEMTETILAQWGQCYGIDMESLAKKRE